jgi:predicted TIM-barrel fold metal-dependent hydrolase
MFEKYTDGLYPPDGVIFPIERRPETNPNTGLPAGTKVFSADDHISLAEDIWYKNFPANLRGKAPRVWFGNGVFNIGFEAGKSLLPQGWIDAVISYEGMPGCSSAQIAARMADLEAEGIHAELAFPNAVLVLLHHPDLEVRELCFRIYNQYMADLQASAPGRFYGVGLINWWDPAGARKTLAELKSLGLKTFLMPLNPGNGPDGQPIDYASDAMTAVWAEIEASGIPVSHHIGETPMRGCQYNGVTVGFLVSTGSFRELFGRYVFGGILDRHPALQVGWFEGGINWVVSTVHDAEHAYASYKRQHNLKLKHDPEYYWRNHMVSSFIRDPLGLEMIDRLGFDRVLWSMDYPHNESTWGYGRASLKQVVDAAGPERARGIVETNVARFLKL